MLKLYVADARHAVERHQRAPLHRVEPRGEGGPEVSVGSRHRQTPVVGGSRPVSGGVVDPDGVLSRMSGHDDSLLRLGGYRIDRPEPDAVDGHFVGHGGKPQVLGCEGIVADGARAGERRAGDSTRGCLLEHQCRRHAGQRRIAPGVEHGGGARRVERRDLEVHVAEIDAILHQIAESMLAEAALQTLYVVGAQLVNDDSHHEPWSGGFRLSHARECRQSDECCC